MAINWEKMTKENYDKILIFQELIKKDRSRIALIQAEIIPYKNMEEFKEIGIKIDQIMEEYDEINKKLKDFIL